MLNYSFIISLHNEIATLKFQGQNGNIQYQIVHGDQQNQFSIDDKTGMISVATILDREMISSYGEFVRTFVSEGRVGLNIILLFHQPTNQQNFSALFSSDINVIQSVPIKLLR